MFGIDDLISAIPQGISAGLDYKVSQQNLDFQKDKFNYDKQLQQIMFQREDNAVQRRSADMAAAGFNPVLATGAAAQAGPVVSTTAPQMNYSNSQEWGGIGKSLSLIQGASLVEQLMMQKQQVHSAELDNAIKEHNLAVAPDGLPVGTVPDWRNVGSGAMKSVNDVVNKYAKKLLGN